MCQPQEDVVFAGVKIMPDSTKTETRLCTKCNQYLHKDEFHKHNGAKSRSDNLDSWCKSCRSKIRKVSLETKKKHKDKWDKKLKINILSVEDAAYIAGILDGEGCISLSKHHCYDKNRNTTYHLRVRITNTFPGIMDWIALKVGYGNIHKKKKYPEANRESWEWSLSGRRAIAFLNQLYPYLKIKRLQAKVAFKFGKTISYPGQSKLDDKVLVFRKELRQRMSKLNN